MAEIFVYFIALIFSGIWVPEFFTATDTKIDPWSFLSTSVLSGLLTVYIGFLLLGNFTHVFYMCFIIGGISAGWLVYKAQKGFIERVPFDFKLWQVGALGILTVIFLALISSGIFDPEARAIWYFQAKVLHFSNSFNSADWHHPAFNFADMGEPKLLPVVIAFLMSTWEGWHEYLPKYTVLLLLLPFVTVLFALKLSRALTFILLFAFIGIQGVSAWNGSFEGYLAALFALGTLHLAVYQKTKEKNHLLISLILLGLVFNSYLNGIALVLALAVTMVFTNKSVRASLIEDRNVTKFILVPLGAFLLWQSRRIEFHLTDVWALNDQPWSINFVSRLSEVKPLLLTAWLILKAHFSVIVFVLLLAGYFRVPQIKALHQSQFVVKRPEYYWILAVAGIYLVWLSLSYLGINGDLKAYLASHLREDVLVVKFLIVAYVVLSLHDELPAPPPVAPKPAEEDFTELRKVTAAVRKPV